MLIKRPMDILPSEITDESVYLRRRELLKMAGIVTMGAFAGQPLLAAGNESAISGKELSGIQKSDYSTAQQPNSWEDITTYNNYYEFGTAKEDPARNARDFKPHPWTVAVNGECDKPGNYNYEDLVSPHALEERIYRLRCVEAWSMVVPWSGFPMKELVKLAAPTSGAKYVVMQTFQDKSVAPGQRQFWYPWPYTDGLTIEEATNDLTFLVTGLYGKPLPKQHGSPLRLAAPWKYGFKQVKSIVRFSFTDKRPETFWETLISNEYGFWANVNPEVPHPRWSQAEERDIGTGEKIPTLLYNGYGEYVSDMYKDMKGERLFM